MKRYHLTLHHGTIKSCSRSIIKDGFKLPEEKRNDHWLGEGIYFFREDERQAWMWSRNKFKRVRNNAIVVLETNIDISENNYLDLDSRSGIEKFLKWLDYMDDVLEKMGMTYDSEEEDKLRHFFFCMLPDDYKVVKRTFVGESKVIDNHVLLGKMGLKLHGVQVCVRDISVIKEVKVI